MSKRSKKIIGVDLFAGAGGLSLGAEMAGIDVVLAIEKDYHAAETYAFNHPNTQLIVDDVKNITGLNISSEGSITVLFGGPPCQGFSTSNQRTRSLENPSNWLFKEFIRIVQLWLPDWVVFENVRGIVETEKGLFRDSLICDLGKLGYTTSNFVLCASHFGVPQVRSRFFLLASLHGKKADIPKQTFGDVVNVSQAIEDLPSLPNGANFGYYGYSKDAKSDFAKLMRNGLKACGGHFVTKNSSSVIERYKCISQGGGVPPKTRSTFKVREMRIQ